LSEFDVDADALFGAEPLQTSEPFPERAVMCFFPEVIAGLSAERGARRTRHVGAFSRELGGHDVWVVEQDSIPVAVFHPGVGAPLAAIHLETAIASGGRSFVACGGAGAVQPGLALGHVVVPTSAVRDEGTSSHYLPPSRTLDADPKAVAVAVSVLEDQRVPYTLGRSWTTDAPYRETRAKIRRRRDEGCLTVEMETAAFLAVAQFRGVMFVQYLYAGDDVSGEAWDHRGWTTTSARSDLLALAISAAVRL
jgi:uridine phosphorylase